MTALDDKNTQTCQGCDCFVKYDTVLGICNDVDNEHYKHVVHKHHPACGIFFATYDSIEEMLIQHLNEKVLDNQQVV